MGDIQPVRTSTVKTLCMFADSLHRRRQLSSLLAVAMPRRDLIWKLYTSPEQGWRRANLTELCQTTAQDDILEGLAGGTCVRGASSDRLHNLAACLRLFGNGLVPDGF